MALYKQRKDYLVWVSLLLQLLIYDTGANPVGTCPSINGELVTFLKHSYDCTLFYKCQWGNSVLYNCPAGLYFNSKTNVCDWPAKSGCVPDSPFASTTDVSLPTTSEPAPTIVPHVPTTHTSGGPYGTCPSINGDLPVYLPHTVDCTKFYECDWGVPYPFDCPSGLHFNPTLNVCDWPANAGCDPKYSTAVPPAANTTGGAAPTTPAPTTSASGGSAGTCPPLNGDFPVYLPHSTDCTKFFECNGGIPYPFDCPSGLHFNPKLNVCDWPANAGCDPKYSTAAPPSAKTTESTAPTTSATGGPAGTCPSLNGDFPIYLPHIIDCTKFFECDWGTPYPFDCPSGLHFNPKHNVCDWPANAGCDAKYSTAVPPAANTTGDIASTTPAPATSTIGGPAGSCPPLNGDFPVYLPHNIDCTKFFECNWGIPYPFDCPSGLHFNPNLNVCDWPANARCDPKYSTAATPSANTTVNSESTTAAPTTSATGGPAGTCPPLNGDFPVYLPHTIDCTKFFECDWGIPYPFDCPNGLHFNQKLNVCDWPANAGCNPKFSTTVPPAANTTGDAASTTPAPTTPASGRPNGICPPLNGDLPVYLPHSIDCTKFFECDWGTPYSFDCPSGLHFNPKLNVCDWPANAGCDSKYSTAAPPSANTTVNSESTTPAPTTSATGGPAGTCPPLNGDFPVYLPHTIDCTKFFECDWGIPYPFDCPNGLHFNKKLNVCDWPANAGCNPKFSTVVPPAANTAGDAASTTPAPTTPASGRPNGTCPPLNGDLPVYLPHSIDCTKFFECDWGTPYSFDCPSGLHFNPKLNVCDWPANAGCDLKYTTAAPPTANTTRGPAFTTRAPTTSATGGPAGACPTLNGDFPLYLPHTKDCTKFFECDWGIAYPFDCPSGLHFNPTLKICDWPANAGCDPKYTTAAPPTENTTRGPSSTTRAPTTSATGGPAGACPTLNGDFPLYLPHTKDCTKFFECDWGIAYPFDCPSGLHFNPTLNICDWPADAGCSI